MSIGSLHFGSRHNEASYTTCGRVSAIVSRMVWTVMEDDGVDVMVTRQMPMLVRTRMIIFYCLLLEWIGGSCVVT